MSIPLILQFEYLFWLILPSDKDKGIKCYALCAISSGSPPLIRIPFCAPTPVPTITAVGVASPKEQGQAMARTVMEASKAKRTMTSALEMFWLYPYNKAES